MPLLCPVAGALRRRGAALTQHNIWEDPVAAARLRGLTGGTETVPTVVVDGQVLINPRAGAVLALLQKTAPQLPEHSDQAGRVRYRACWQGTVLADSERVRIVEGNVYFPPDAVQQQYLTRTRSHSLCPWKGIASYYTITLADGTANRNAAWTYRHPTPLARRIRNHVAFWAGVTVEKIAPATD
jgi:uncharacterized protein (DUF427 family)